MTSSEKFAYLAGIIDGEGCIAVEKKFPSKRKRFPHYFARLSITNTNINLMNWLCNEFGGKTFNKQASSFTCQPCFSWYAFGTKLESVLQGIFPYSIIKHEQIINIINFRKTVGNTGNHVSQEMRDLRETFYVRSRYLNSLHKLKPSALSPAAR